MNNIFPGIEQHEIPKGAGYSRGKVRDTADLGDEMIIVTSDRISAFDRVLGTVPRKGEVLNRMSGFWFEKTRDICPNHLLEITSPRSMLVRKCGILPVEIIVRGYLTGSAWRAYQEGKTVSGVPLPPGLKLNQRFPAPIITPTTKEEQGAHDRPVSGAEIVRTGLVPEKLWEEAQEKARALFLKGTEIAGRNGLILVDTKYEFGTVDGNLIIADEIHTPDSSRFWYADTYQELFDRGEKQRKLDKEYLRQWLMDHGYMGDGDPPEIPEAVFLETGSKYIRAYTEITGENFPENTLTIEAEKKKILSLIDERL
jgi:phosphoribosylaminoimidazole-succinocarboxamide synthase